MTVADLLGSALVAGVVSGTVVFTYQQWLQARIERIEADLERQRSYGKYTNEMLVSAYRKIWAGLVEIEYWLRHDLWTEIQTKSNIDPEEWVIFYETYKNFRAEMLFLPDRLYDRTLDLIQELESNSNKLLDALREVLNAKQKDPEGYAADQCLLSLVNAAMQRLTGDYRGGLDDLRRDYQVISRDLLLGEQIPERLTSPARR